MSKFIELNYTEDYHLYGEKPGTAKVVLNVSEIKSVEPSGKNAIVYTEHSQYPCIESYEWIKEQLDVVSRIID